MPDAPGTVRLSITGNPFLVDEDIIIHMTDEKGNNYSVILTDDAIQTVINYVQEPD